MTRYFTGRACKHGHIAERNVSTANCVQCHSEDRKRHYAANKQRIISQQLKVYREKTKSNPAEMARRNERSRLYRRCKRDLVNAHTRNRRAMIKAAAGSHTVEDVREIYAFQKGRCAICRARLGVKYQVDHIIPLAKGGGNGRNNLQLLCAPCNRSKNAKDPLVYAREIGRLL